MLNDIEPQIAPPAPDALARLSAIVGPQHALTQSEDQAPYLREWRDLYRGTTPLVLRPGSVDEISRIMALAHETGTVIVPQGGNTGLVGGQIPYGNEVVLSLSRLKAVRAIDPVGNTMTAEAGITLAEIQAAAEKVDRLFPLSLASEGSCQIGGNLATNAGGVQMLAYGNARDMALGLEVVLANGDVWNGLRVLRKDNTGYDLKDIFIGSEGTLGIITAAVLKLFPRPLEKATMFCGLASLEDAARLFELARASAGPALTAFELMPRIGIEYVLRHGPGSRDPLATGFPWYVLWELSGLTRDSGAGAMAERVLAEAFEAGIVQDATLAASGQQGNDFWRLRELMSEVQREEGGSIKHDISVPISAIPEFITRANQLVEALVPGARPVPFGHFGDGNIHYNVSQPVGADKAEFLTRWDDVAGAVHGLVLELNGSVSAEHGVGRMKREEIARIKSPVEMTLMRKLKAAFDPNGILNPGKVL